MYGTYSKWLSSKGLLSIMREGTCASVLTFRVDDVSASSTRRSTVLDSNRIPKPNFGNRGSQKIRRRCTSVCKLLATSDRRFKYFQTEIVLSIENVKLISRVAAIDPRCTPPRFLENFWKIFFSVFVCVFFRNGIKGA